jgi:membrane fusion protein (multidrug efflux system)
VPVTVVPIRRATVRAYVTGYGVVEPEPAHDGQPPAGAKLAPPLPGLVSETRCTEGDHVEKGAVLFRLDSRAARVQAERATRALAFAEQQVARQKKLVPIEGTSRKAAEEAEAQLAAARSEVAATTTQLALHDITAPFSGVITKVTARPGEMADLNIVLGELVDLDRLEVAAQVPGEQARAVNSGQSVLIETAGVAGDPLQGNVTRVVPQVDLMTGAVTVRVRVPPGSSLRPGQFAAVRIITEERRDRLVVPFESVVRDAEAGSVVAIVEAETATQHPIRVGLRDGALVEVEGEGLREGLRVVARGAYALPKETKVRVLSE